MYYTNKRLGQHFIKDSNIHKKIVRTAGDLSSYSVVEIGPGYGDLTKAILSAQPRAFVAIEKDTTFHEHYVTEFPEQISSFIFGDALAIDEKSLVDHPIKIIANLPFNISSQLILKWLKYINVFNSITVMLQKEFAMRLVAKSGCKDYGRISVMCQLLCNIKYEFTVNPQAFVPPPKVDSSVINIIPLAQPRFEYSHPHLIELTRFVFSYRRKQMQGIMRNFLSGNALLSEDILKSSGISNTSRPGDLSVEDYCRISLELAKRDVMQ